MRRRAWVIVIVGLLVAVLGLPAARADRSPIWRRVPGGQLMAVTTAPDGSIYVSGSVLGRDGERAVVARYAASGARIWRRTWLEQPEEFAVGYAVAAAPSGGVYVGGVTGLGDGGFGLLLRYSADGRVLWHQRLAPREGLAAIVGLAARGDRVIAAVVDHRCCEVPVHDGYLQAFGTDGSTQWRTDFEVSGVAADTRDSVAAVAMGPRGRIFVAGQVDRTTARGAGPAPDEDIAILALDRTGHPLWSRVVGDGQTGRDEDHATSVDVRGELVVVTGVTWTRPRQAPRAWIGGFDTDGHRRWVRHGDQRARSSSATWVAIAPWGGVYVGLVRGQEGGPFSSWLRRYDRNGRVGSMRALGEEPRGWITGIATSGSVYLTIGRELQRWRR